TPGARVVEHSQQRELEPVANVTLQVDHRETVLDRLDRQPERACDLAIGLSGEDAANDVAFAWCQIEARGFGHQDICSLSRLALSKRRSCRSASGNVPKGA